MFDVKKFCADNGTSFESWGFNHDTFQTTDGRTFRVNWHDSGHVTGVHPVVPKQAMSACWNCGIAVHVNQNVVDGMGTFCDDCI